MPNILIIDAHPYVRELLMKELMEEGYLVEATGDGVLIRELVRFSRPDLVLLDLYMKGSDSWDVLLDIKKEDPQLPVLIVTAHDNYMEDFRMSHADGYVIKSIYFDELKLKITEILNRKQICHEKGNANQYFPQFTATRNIK